MTTEHPMQLGMVGLGRMGSNLVRRLMRDGHRCVVYDVSASAVASLSAEGATGADIVRARQVAERKIGYVDCGTSGGIWGLERGCCLMIGGESEVVQRLDPIFRTIAPGSGSAEPTPGRAPGGTAQEGYVHCGPAGAGHFVKKVHNGIEYGMMAANAQGLSLLKHANAGEGAQETHAQP